MHDLNKNTGKIAYAVFFWNKETAKVYGIYPVLAGIYLSEESAKQTVQQIKSDGEQYEARYQSKYIYE